MRSNIEKNNPRSAAQWYDLGLSYRRKGEFGKAVNAFESVKECAMEEVSSGSLAQSDCDNLISKAEASIQLISRITGFVNKDLMNP